MDTKLLEMLVCPVTKGPLIYDRDKQELISRTARLAYPIRDGIPVMLEDEARKLTPEECEELQKWAPPARPEARAAPPRGSAAASLATEAASVGARQMKR